MSAAIINAITWDPNDPIISAQNLITQLELLDADWTSKLQYLIQVNSDDEISKTTLEAAAELEGRDPDDPLNLFRWFDMDTQEIVNTYAFLFNSLQPFEGPATPGKAERIFFFEGHISGIPEHITDGDVIYDITKTLPHDARVIVHYPLMQSGGSSPSTYSYMWFEPKLDGTEVLGVAASSGDQPICAPFRAVSAVNFPYFLKFAYPDVVPAGSHQFTCDLHLDAAVTKIPALTVIDADYGPPIHRNAPDYNTYGTANVDFEYLPIQGYLELIYV